MHLATLYTLKTRFSPASSGKVSAQGQYQLVALARALWSASFDDIIAKHFRGGAWVSTIRNNVTDPLQKSAITWVIKA